MLLTRKSLKKREVSVGLLVHESSYGTSIYNNPVKCVPPSLHRKNIMLLITVSICSSGCSIFILTQIRQPQRFFHRFPEYLLLLKPSQDKILCWILSPLNKWFQTKCYRDAWVIVLANLCSRAVSRAICCVKTATTDHRYSIVLYALSHDLTDLLWYHCHTLQYVLSLSCLCTGAW